MASPTTSKKMVLLLSVLGVYCAVLTGIYINFPEMKAEERQHFKYPRSLEDAKQLGQVFVIIFGKVLSRYKERHFYTVLCGVAAVYVVLQSFAIPGSIFLTILSGYLFPFPVALALVCLCSASGAAVCYALSHSLGRKIMLKYFPERILKWQAEVQKQRENLFNYIVFLRVTPILPNWFINIASPLLDVPLKPFFFGTLAGVAPPSFLFIQAGTTLQMMTTTNAMWSWSSTGMLGFFAVLSLLPVVYKHYKFKSD